MAPINTGICVLVLQSWYREEMRFRLGAGRRLEMAFKAHQVCHLIGQPSVGYRVAAVNYPCAVASARLSGNWGNGKWCICLPGSDSHPSKSILIFSQKAALRGNTINWLLKYLDLLRSLDMWCYISSRAECSWLCTRKHISLTKAGLVAYRFVFPSSLEWDKVLKQEEERGDWGLFRFHRPPTQQVSWFHFIHVTLHMFTHSFSYFFLVTQKLIVLLLNKWMY